MDAGNRENQPLWLDAFRKILALEAHKGFADTAVSGGIRRFVERWESELREHLAGDPSRVREFIERPYRDLPVEQRREWVSRWQAALDGVPVPQSVPAQTEIHTPPTLPQLADGQPLPPETPALFAPTVGIPSVRMRRKAYVPPPTSNNPGDPDEPVSKIRRMDGKTVQRLEQLGASTVRDLLYMMPRRYEDRSEITAIDDVYPGASFTMEGQLADVRSASVGQRRLRLVEGILSGDGGQIELQWFGQGYLARALHPGSQMIVNGKVELHRGRLSLSSPEYDVVTERQPPLNAGRVVPVYRLTAGLTARNLRSLTWQAISKYLQGLPDPLPEDVLQRTGLCALSDAIRDIHYPSDLAAADRGRRRLAFDEILAFQLAILGRRRHRERNATGVPIKYHSPVVEGFLSALPFAPTGAQIRCIAEILGDLSRGVPPMSRLLQGEW